jgi:hypothetical protein
MRNALVQPKRPVLAVSTLLRRRLVFDDDLDVLHHLVDPGRQRIDGLANQSFEPLSFATFSGIRTDVSHT